ncbi:UNVERIFIED_CONTAM: hypothetical protein GTU68_037787 [Idotea baltica]|nr:hypothetical protein [Idotea baltica]
MDTYLPKLVKAGYRVAICEQLEDPKKTKKIVKRGVTELVTPGLAINDKILDYQKNNFLASIYFGEKRNGIAFLDISTGEFWLSEGSKAMVDKLVQSFQPAEIIYANPQKSSLKQLVGDQYYAYPIDEWAFEYDFGREKLTRHFKTTSLKGFGIEGMDAAIISAGAILHYLNETEHAQLQHITTIKRLEQEHYVWLDRFSIRNLELLYSQHDTGIPLISILDKCVSPMGKRLMRKWIVLPLKDKNKINARLDTVEYFIEHPSIQNDFIQQLKQVADLERLIAKVPLKRINPRELNYLKNSLKLIESIKVIGLQSESPLIAQLVDQLNPCSVIIKRIENELEEEAQAPMHISKGKVIRDGINEQLDEWRGVAYSGKEKLLEIQKREQEKTGITSLKISFNNVFGYYLEVTNRYKDKVPETWIRKQTLVNAERYITPELKEYENKILQAEELLIPLEIELFTQLVASLMDYITAVQLNADILAKIDSLLAFSKISDENDYCKPIMDDSLSLELIECRHPVIEKSLPLGEEYVPNDISLGSEEQQVIIITGPNMSGKSAILRQTALAVLMAQIGCFVPAKKANIGIVDKIFTRVGASDNISSGESTFMVEMNETASIMNNLSARSLVLLDEIGRGTSTYDGISIAWSLAEYLHQQEDIRPKTLFATHYHELNELADKYDRIVNYSVATKEHEKKVIFLRKLIRGGSKHSFGIHVAQMAGMPPWILNRATVLLTELEQQSITEKNKKHLNQSASDLQLNLFQMDRPVLLEVEKLLSEIDVNTLTPVEALMQLHRLKEKLK